MENNESSGSVRQSRWPLLISLTLIAGLVILYFAVPEVRQFIDTAYRVLTSRDEEQISNWVESLGFWGPLFIIVGMVVQMFLIIIPSPVLMLVSVLAYGSLLGTVLAISAVLIASTIGYWLGYLLGDVSVKKVIGQEKERRLKDYVERFGIWAIVLTRLIPFLSNDAISFVGGLLGMRYLKFITATAIGITPLAILIAYFGENSDRLKKGMIWVAGAAVVFFIGYYFFQKRKGRAVG